MGGLFRTVSHVLARLFALIPICVFFAHKSGPLFLPLFSRNKKIFWKNFFRNMSGPPRAGHIWTDPGAWFFHLQFYKKYVIIFKKSKISHENFFAWTFYRKDTVHNKRMEIRLTIEILFWQSQAKIFLKTAGKKFFWKLQAKSASKILYAVKYGYFIVREMFITRERKWDLLSKDFFWKCGGHFFLRSKISLENFGYFQKW